MPESSLVEDNGLSETELINGEILERIQKIEEPFGSSVFLDDQPVFLTPKVSPVDLGKKSERPVVLRLTPERRLRPQIRS
jgi:hypothetical protein